jgi:ribose 5-phosphate isomerase B
MERLRRELVALHHELIDLGVWSAEPPVDYPDLCIPVGELVARGEAERGIVLGGSGIGEAIAANKVPGVRAAVVTSDETARLTRLGARTNDHEAAVRWMRIWLETPFEGGRHIPRLRKIREYEAHLPPKRQV